MEGTSTRGCIQAIILSYFRVSIQSLKVAIVLVEKLEEFDGVWAFSVGGVAEAPFEVMAGAACNTVVVKLYP